VSGVAPTTAITLSDEGRRRERAQCRRYGACRCRPAWPSVLRPNGQSVRLMAPILQDGIALVSG